MSKSVQVLFEDNSYDALRSLAAKKGISEANIIREGVRLFVVHSDYADRGKKLLIQDEKTGKVEGEFIIEGLK